MDESDYKTAESEEWKTQDLSEKFAKLAHDPKDFKIEGESKNKDIVDDILIPVGAIKPKDEQCNVE